MERESFEDEEVAGVLNRDFISIKVDREERPDIDSIYMSVCQALTGHGGWPMTIVMTPDRKPFFAGTYFPKSDRMGLPGILSVLRKTSQAWQKNRSEVLETADSILDAVSGTADADNRQSGAISGMTQTGTPVDGSPDLNDYKKLIHAAFEQYRRAFDSIHGGFGNAPKFPSPHIFFFLLRYWKRTGEESALRMTEKTLESMRRGGIFDHIGYGFCRYSTDRRWLVPHFEKMLYDNALLAMAYLETYQATGNGSYAMTADDIFTYVLRDMTSHEGGFYSAEDADSEDEEGEKEEGRFYTWTTEEIQDVLGDSDAERFMLLFDITSRGNFEDRNIPNTINGRIPGEDLGFVDACRKKLFDARENRKHPFKDDKILTSWNGLMISALAMGGRVLGNSRYTDAAEKAADFVLKNLIDHNGRLLAVYRETPSPLKAYADDYAFFVWGLLELYETTYKAEYLKNAIKLNSDLLELFSDSKGGGLYLYGSDSEQLIMRPKEAYDGAMPSANSVTANNLVRLARLTGRSELEEQAILILQAFAGSVEGYPAGHSHLLNSAILLDSEGSEIVIAGELGKGADKLLEVIRQGFRPFTVSIRCEDRDDVIRGLIPFTSSYTPVEGKAAAYVCKNYTCSQPVTDAGSLKDLLQ